MSNFVINLRQSRMMLTVQHTVESNWQYILGFIAIFFIPQMQAFIAVGLLVFIDLFTGLWRARKMNVVITSDRLKDTVTKLLLYNALLITAMIAERYMVEQIPFIEVSLGIIAVAETKSIYENIGDILGINIVKAFKDVMRRNKLLPKSTNKKTKKDE